MRSRRNASCKRGGRYHVLSKRDSPMLLIFHSCSHLTQEASVHPPPLPPPPQIRCHRTQTSPLPAGQSRHLVGDCILALSCPRPPGPAGRQEAEEGGGPIPLRASFCRSLVPNCPPGSDPSRHGCAPSGMLSRRVKWPAASGRWEPVTAIFNLIKAVSTIDFGSFNY